jgi:hypothetical protein
MSLPQTYGENLTFGLTDVTNSFVVIQSDSLKNSCGVSIEAKDEYGRIITVRKDDLIKSLNFTGILKTGATPPTAGNTIVYGSVTYILDDVSDDGTNESFRRVAFTGRKFSQI